MQFVEIIIAALILGFALFLITRSLRSKSKGACASCSGCQTKCPDEKSDEILLINNQK